MSQRLGDVRRELSDALWERGWRRVEIERPALNEWWLDDLRQREWSEGRVNTLTLDCGTAEPATADGLAMARRVRPGRSQPPGCRDRDRPPGSCMSAKVSRTVLRIGTG